MASVVTSADVGLVASKLQAIENSRYCSEESRRVLSCDRDVDKFYSCGEAIAIPTDQGAVAAGSLAASCSIEARPYSDFACACAVAVAPRKTNAAAGASANMIEELKTMEDIGEVVVISIASGAIAAVVICRVYEATQNLDRSQQ